MQLTVIDGGINRQRTKGGANPRTLYDLLNGYVTAARTVKVRPGTIRTATLPAGTKGLTAFAGEFHVFAASVVEVPPGFVNHVLLHPDYSDDAPTPADFELAEIHFAEPFLGFLYVAAEFGNGDVYHYWLQSAGPWQPDTVYGHGDMVEPTTPNGIAYLATRISSPSLSWAPNVPRAEGDVVEPTVYNDYYYTVVETAGSNPVSGTLEPTWPQAAGAQVTEDTQSDPGGPPGTTPPPDTQTPMGEVERRYYSPKP